VAQMRHEFWEGETDFCHEFHEFARIGTEMKVHDVMKMLYYIGRE